MFQCVKLRLPWALAGTRDQSATAALLLLLLSSCSAFDRQVQEHYVAGAGLATIVWFFTMSGEPARAAHSFTSSAQKWPWYQLLSAALQQQQQQQSARKLQLLSNLAQQSIWSSS
jgi:arginine exporter protein ArgO